MIIDYLRLDEVELSIYFKLVRELERMNHMKISFFKIISVFSVVVRWADKALSDGRIDSQEALDLVVGILEAVGLPASVTLPDEFKHISNL